MSSTDPRVSPVKMPQLNILSPLLEHGSRVFREASDAPLLVSCNCPTTLCNYRCSYCYLDHDNRDAKGEARGVRAWQRTMERIIKIKRPLYLAIGTEGEPLVVKPFFDLLRQISPLEHVKGIWFPTNLSRPIEEIAEGVDISKLGLTASLHPSEFSDHDRSLNNFLSRCEWVRENGGDVVINFILTPGQFDLFPAYRWIARERGIPMTANVFKGVYQGKSYPESYTEEEHALFKEFFEDRPLVHEFMSGRSSRGVPCNAGRDLIHVEAARGAVWNCPFAMEPMGSIWDDDFSVRNCSSPCTTDWCECHWTIGLTEEMSERFSRTKSILNYEARSEPRAGARPFS